VCKGKVSGLGVSREDVKSTYMSHLIPTIDAAMIDNRLEEVGPRFKERDGMMNMVRIKLEENCRR
jgi:hypothetical protein